MKAVVLELKNGYAAVLREDSSVVRIQRPCAVGDIIEVSDRDEIPVKSKYKFRAVKTFVKAAAIALVVGVVSAGSYMTASANSTVTVSTDGAQVTLKLNYFDRVIDVSSEDEEIVKSLYDEGIQFNDLSDALDKTENVLTSKGLAEENEKPAVHVESGNEQTAEKLNGQAKEKGFETDRAETEPDGTKKPAEEIQNEVLPESDVNEQNGVDQQQNAEQQKAVDGQQEINMQNQEEPQKETPDGEPEEKMEEQVNSSQQPEQTEQTGQPEEQKSNESPEQNKEPVPEIRTEQPTDEQLPEFKGEMQNDSGMDTQPEQGQEMQGDFQNNENF